jgi:outer membrane biogenesis lipoprotein LolB
MHRRAWIFLPLLAVLLISACAGSASAPTPADVSPPNDEPAETSARPELIYFHATW